jgi:hypothetical protein
VLRFGVLEASFCNDAGCPCRSPIPTGQCLKTSRLADETEEEAARDAYLALAELWRERSIRLEGGIISTKLTRYG